MVQPKKVQQKKTINYEAQIRKHRWNAYKEITPIKIIPLALLNHMEQKHNPLNKDIVQNCEEEIMIEYEHLANDVDIKNIPFVKKYEKREIKL